MKPILIGAAFAIGCVWIAFAAAFVIRFFQNRKSK